MKLHDHPVNRERESLARGVANGLWFGDGGTLPAPTRPLPGRMTFAEVVAVGAVALDAGEAHAAEVASLGAALRAGASATDWLPSSPPTPIPRPSNRRGPAGVARSAPAR
jgi:hypothetical protein